MDKIKKFNWDNYIDTASYNKVLDGMGCFRKLIPTMFSPDKEQIYLKTDDIAYNVNDIDILNLKLTELLERIKDKARSVKWSYETLYLLQVDYLAISSILNDKDELPEGYKYPEYYLELAMKDFKADSQAQDT